MNRYYLFHKIYLLLRTNQQFVSYFSNFADKKLTIHADRNETVETLRSRLIYQSKKRGILENDILIGGFAEINSLKNLNYSQLIEYDKIINGEHNEWDLYYYLSGRKELPADLKNSEVFKIIIDFVNEKKRRSFDKKKKIFV